MAGKLTLDRGALKNPSTAHLRIYVGNLAECVTEEHLYDRFIEYGKINGIAINRGFSFIQFDSQESVKKAIEAAHQTLFFDNKPLNVRCVQPKNGPMDAQPNYHEPPPPPPPEPSPVAEEPENMQHDNYESYAEENQNQGTTSFESVKLLDRSAMKNPATTHLRIYVGNLSDSVTAEQLYNRFIEYGHIDGIVINRGFGFIQFYKEESAKKAIEQANRTPFQDGRKLLVSPVQSKNKGDGDGTNAHTDKPFAAADGNAPATEDTEENQDEFGGDGQAGAYETDASYDESGFPKRVRVRGRRRGRGRGAAQGGGGPGGGAGGAPPTGPPPGPPPVGFRDRSPIAMGREGRFERFDRFTAPPRTLPLTDRNDCEIIVVSKALTEYAEYIEGRLKRLGIVVDLLFPMEDVPIGKVLGNIASRGCLYAILVMPINQERRSLTLTILHGIPQEHRNMRVEDALSLLARNFEEVRRGGAAGREAVYALLGQLADGRALTALQYDKVIEYLKERREQQAKIELGEPLQSSTSKPAQTELQQRILKILNEKIAATSETAPSPAAPPAPSAAAPPTSGPAPALAAAADPPKAKLLNDPSVRKALDSILQKYA